jgi:hypothetical protein
MTLLNNPNYTLEYIARPMWVQNLAAIAKNFAGE